MTNQRVIQPWYQAAEHCCQMSMLPQYRRQSSIHSSHQLLGHAKIGESTLADAILDRIVHDSYTIELYNSPSEPSMREVYGLKND